MNFFEQQDQARRMTRRLLGLFLFAVLALIVLANLIVMLALYGAQLESVNGVSLFHLFNWQLFVQIGAFVCLVVAVAIIAKALTLRHGGKVIAEALHGRRILPSTEVDRERQLLNVVEEMAIASGMAVPPVYLLAENGINAFAAGNTPADAVIGITQGALNQLSRDHIQGVVAHEFSHILNGDMRLNNRLIAVLFGILFIGQIGEIILYSGRSGSFGRDSSDLERPKANQSGVLFVGVGFVVIGWLGSFFGGLIKAAVSRQREYLADASAVQFTRDPQAVAGALKTIGGHSYQALINDVHAHEISHIFFAQALKFRWGGFATHPMLESRIQRIDPAWDGRYVYPDVQKPVVQKTDAQKTTTKAAQQSGRKEMFTTAVATAVIADALNLPASVQLSHEDERSKAPGLDQLIKEARDPFGANALTLAMLIDSDAEINDRQYGIVAKYAAAGSVDHVRHIVTLLAGIAAEFRLPLLEIAVASLKCLSKNQYVTLKQNLLRLIKADNKVDMFEWCLFQIVRHSLDVEFGFKKPGSPRYKNVNQVREAFEVIISMLAHHGHQEEATLNLAFGKGANTAGLYDSRLMDLKALDNKVFTQAVDKVGDSFPLLKARLIKALVATAAKDGEICNLEREMITAIAFAIDIPLPREITNGSIQLD